MLRLPRVCFQHVGKGIVHPTHSRCIIGKVYLAKKQNNGTPSEPVRALSATWCCTVDRSKKSTVSLKTAITMLGGPWNFSFFSWGREAADGIKSKEAL
jgi:hypothetical protein